MKIGIIGAGPAGSMAAIASASKDNQIHLFEKNEKIGKKLYITGKGRCNLTNAKDISQFMDYIATNKKFLYPAFNRFSNLALMNFFKSQGLSLKKERGDRVFPKSDKSSDVIKCLEDVLRERKVNIHLNTEILDVYKQGQYFYLVTQDQLMTFDRLIICTGGMSYPSTGSDGDGYEFAKKLGHKIVEIKPGLNQILIEDSFIKSLQGVSLVNVSLNIKRRKKTYSEFGDLVFTDRGISGPIALTLSSIINKFSDENLKVSIDLKPALDEKTLDDRLIREFDENSNKNLSKIMENLSIRALIPIILNQAKLDGHIKGNQVTKKMRRRLLETLKCLKFNYGGLDDVKYAIVTSGGVKVSEIDSHTMESKIIDGLYFAGEVIDVDAFTGGYNLQIAFSTGYLAGISCLEGDI